MGSKLTSALRGWGCRRDQRGFVREVSVEVLTAAPSSAFPAVKAGDKVTIHSGGSRSVGTVNAVLSDGSALGLMRLEAVGRALAGEVQLVAGDGGGVTPVVPGWWPPEWMDLAAEAPSAE